MSKAREVVTQIVTTLSGNIAASSLASLCGSIATAVGVGAAGTAIVTAGATILPLALFAGVTLRQVSKQSKADDEQIRLLRSIESAISRLAADAESKRRAEAELVELALEQGWVAGAASNGADALNRAVAGEAREILLSLNVKLDDIKCVIDEGHREFAILAFDTNERVRDVQAGVGRIEAGQNNLATKDDIAELKKLFLAGATGDASVDESTKRDLAHGLVVLAERAERGHELAARALADRSPGEAVDALVAERERVRRAKAAALARVAETELALDRSISATAYLTGRIPEAEDAIERVLALLPDDLDAINRLGHVKRLRGELDEAVRLYTRVGELATDDPARAASLGNLGLIEQTRGTSTRPRTISSDRSQSTRSSVAMKG